MSVLRVYACENIYLNRWGFTIYCVGIHEKHFISLLAFWYMHIDINTYIYAIIYATWKRLCWKNPFQGKHFFFAKILWHDTFFIISFPICCFFFVWFSYSVSVAFAGKGIIDTNLIKKKTEKIKIDFFSIFRYRFVMTIVYQLTLFIIDN